MSARLQFWSSAVPAPIFRPAPRVTLLAWLRAAKARWRQRQALAALDDRMLRDIGVSRSEAANEANKPFWVR